MKTLAASRLSSLTNEAVRIANFSAPDLGGHSQAVVRAEIIRCVLPELIENEKGSE